MIEELAAGEYGPGVSAGAAARQMCSSLGDEFPTLKRLLEDMLADANRASHDRAMILHDFDAANPVLAQEARMASFKRVNLRAGK